MTYPGISSLVAGSTLLGASSGYRYLGDSKLEMIERERTELEMKKRFLSLEKAGLQMKTLFPNLTEAQIRSKVERMSVTGLSETQRLEILFDHDATLKPLINASLELEKLMSQIIVNGKNVSPSSLSMLRGQSELPQSIEVYLNQLVESLWEEDFQKLERHYALAIENGKISDGIQKLMDKRFEAIKKDINEFYKTKNSLLKEFR